MLVATALAADIPFTYRQGGIPDLDQRREAKNGHVGLPNDGREYCAPTSAINCITFIVNHGYANLPPFGPKDWSGQTFYDYAGDTIASMGGGMSTDPNKGTTGDGHIRGTRGWLTRDLGWITFSDFVVSAQFAGGQSCPGPNELANLGLQGAVVMPIVGWYNLISAGNYERKGGHVLTMNKITGRNTVSGTEFKISWRDPARDDGNFATQSQFSTETYTLNPVNATFDGGMRTQYQVVSYNSGTNIGFIDGYVAILPKYGLSWAPGDFEFDLVDFSQIAGSYHTPSFVSADGGIHRAALNADMTHIAYLTLPDLNHQSSLRRLDTLNSSSAPIQDGLQNPIALTVSRHRRAYVLEDGGISLGAYDLDYIEGNMQTTLPQYLNTLAYDDFADRVFVLGTLNQRLIALPPDLTTQSDTQLPNGLTISFDAQLFASPATGHLWIVSQSAAALYELEIDQNGVATLLSTVSDVALANATGLSVDELDHVYVSTSTGAGLEFAHGQSGPFERVSPSILDGRTIGAMFQMSADRSNFDPNTMIGPAFEDVLPTEFAPSAFDGAPSTFDQDAGEWTVVGFDYDFPAAPYAESDALWNATGGNPGGALETTDVYNETFFAAPVPFLGDRSAAYGASLTFDILVQDNDQTSHPAVILASPSKRLYYMADGTDAGVWTTRIIPLSETGWRVNDWQGADATASDMLEVLGDLQGLYINATWNAGADDTLLDNVYFGDQPQSPCPGDLNGDRAVDLSDLAALLANYGQVGVPPSAGDLNGDGNVDLADLAALLAQYGVICP